MSKQINSKSLHNFLMKYWWHELLLSTILDLMLEGKKVEGNVYKWRHVIFRVFDPPPLPLFHARTRENCCNNTSFHASLTPIPLSMTSFTNIPESWNETELNWFKLILPMMNNVINSMFHEVLISWLIHSSKVQMVPIWTWLELRRKLFLCFHHHPI